MDKPVAKSTAKGVVWSMVERVSTMGIQLLCTLVMAQFLSPSEFGLVGMISIFMAFSNIIIDAGFSQAIIREKNVTAVDYSSVFLFNIALGCALYSLFFILAPFISQFYNEPRLTAIIRVSFLAMIIFSTTAVQQARLFKAVDFAKVSKVSLVAVVISGTIGIVTAWVTRSVWALVAQSLSFSVCRSLMLWIVGKWRPSAIFKWTSIRKYLGFSLNLLATNIVAAITDNLPNLFIGKSYSATTLGNYTIPDKLQRSVAGTLSFSIHRVSYPVMATFQDDIDRLRDYSQKIVGMAFFIIAPIMMFLFVEATDIFDILLPSDWSAAPHYFRYMCIIGAVYCFADINLDVLMVKGESSKIFRIEIIRKIVFVAALVIGIFHSIDYFLTILIIYNVFNALFVSYFSGRVIDCSLKRQIENILNTVIVLIFTTGMALMVHDGLDEVCSLLRFIVVVLLYFIIYLSLSILLRNRNIIEAKSLMRRFICHT